MWHRVCLNIFEWDTIFAKVIKAFAYGCIGILHKKIEVVKENIIIAFIT